MRPVWAITGGLVALAAFVGLRLGHEAGLPSETQLIEAAAAAYVAGAPGRQRTECFAVPGTAPGVRLVVHCGAERFALGPRGGFVSPGGDT